MIGFCKNAEFHIFINLQIRLEDTLFFYHHRAGGDLKYADIIL